jgi:virginiamycin B lyase
VTVQDAGSFMAQINLKDGSSRVVVPPTRAQGARRVWADSRGRIWVGEWLSGQVSVHDLASGQWRAWKLPGANAVLRFDPGSERLESWVPPREVAHVRQILGRPGEVWLPESGTEHITLMPVGG